MSAPATPTPALPRLLDTTWRDLVSTDLLDLVPRVTLLVALVSAGHTALDLVASLERGAVVVGTAACLLFAVVGMAPRLYRNPWVWLLVSAILGIRNVLLWHGLDNHYLLINYWCLALGLSLFTSDPRRALALNGRLLVGLVFAFATFWKLASPEYRDGSFFQYELLTDDRFEGLARTLAGISRETDRLNDNRIQDLYDLSLAPAHVELAGGPRLVPVAAFATVYGIVVEGAIAIAFLLPGGPRLGRVRDGTLLLFGVTTYAMIPVTTFGALLVLMGRCQTRGGPLVERLYLLALGALIAWRPVWEALMERLV